MAVKGLAETLAESGDVFGSDEDPELIRAAAPFSLKTIESLIQEFPDHPGLLLSACSGFTQYAYAFIQTDAEFLEPTDYQASLHLRERAIKMYLRARGYCIRNLELKHRGIARQLIVDPRAALASAKPEEVPVLYWTGASWGSAISLGLDRLELIADFPVVQAMMERALELDKDFSGGAIHTALIVLEGLPETMGGSRERARRHYRRAVELSEGLSASPHLALATSVSIPAQEREEFEQVLKKALAVDPDKDRRIRLANLIAQKRARFLLEYADELFVEPLQEESP